MVKSLKDLEKENGRPKKLVADEAQDGAMLAATNQTGPERVRGTLPATLLWV